MLRVISCLFFLASTLCQAVYAADVQITLEKIYKIETDIEKYYPNKRSLYMVIISSDTELFAKSINSHMVLSSRVNLCSDKKYEPIGSNDVFKEGKTIDYYLMNKTLPLTASGNNFFKYELYINASLLDEHIKMKNTGEICIKVKGSRYFGSFESNVIRIPVQRFSMTTQS
jgi:hypothetical protein